jgi:hypothetical protein
MAEKQDIGQDASSLIPTFDKIQLADHTVLKRTTT